MLISWARGNDGCGKCKGKLQTDLPYETLSKADRSCVPQLAGIGVKVKLGNCRKRARKDVPVPVPVPMHVPVPGRAVYVYKEQLSLRERV